VKLCLLVGAILACWLRASAQPADVEVYRRGRQQTEMEDRIRDEAKALFLSSNTVRLAAVKLQLKRASCELVLPAPHTSKLSPRAICAVGNSSHVRVGWAYTTSRNDGWHVNLAGGYFLTADGAVATCYHVADPDSSIKEGCLVAANETGRVFAVTEVLAANRYSDACILRIAGADFTALPLSTNVYPGDAAYCFSDPLDQRGYFSAGIVNRFYQFPGRRPLSAPDATPYYAPTRLNVSTDWAPGSSGSAVMDECANAIGHVSTISAVSEDEISPADNLRLTGPTMIVFHEAVSARDVLRLIRISAP
jgi:hypothetical protein